MTLVWISVIALWLCSGAVIALLDMWFVNRRINKLLEQYKRDSQKYISMSEAEALPKTTGEKLYSAWLEKIDADLEDTK